MDSTKTVRNRPDAARSDKTQCFRGLLSSGLSGSRFLQPALSQNHRDAARRISQANSGVISTEIPKSTQKNAKIRDRTEGNNQAMAVSFLLKNAKFSHREKEAEVSSS